MNFTKLFVLTTTMTMILACEEIEAGVSIGGGDTYTVDNSGCVNHQKNHDDLLN